MDLAALNIFRAVVRENGVTRAAAKLNRVQSNVTTRIKQLEEQLGTELFIRDGRRLVLTPAGETLLPYAADDHVGRFLTVWVPDELGHGAALERLMATLGLPSFEARPAETAW